MSTLLCIDPGRSGKGQTGVVLLSFTQDRTPEVLFSWAINGGFDGWLDWALTDDEANVNMLAANYVVCEHFVQRNTPNADLTPCFIEGSVRTLRRDTVLQPASGKNTIAPDSLLKSLGLWFPGDHHHDRREAARHGIVWLIKQRHTPTLRAARTRQDAERTI